MAEFGRGHRMIQINNSWCWEDTREPVQYSYNENGQYSWINRECARCGLPPTPEGHDPCLGRLPGVQFACCGHGTGQGYVLFNNGKIFRFMMTEWPNNVRDREVTHVASQPESWTERWTEKFWTLFA